MFVSTLYDIPENAEDGTELVSRYWFRNEDIFRPLCEKFANDESPILDVGGASSVFDPATHVIDQANPSPGRLFYKLDLDFDRFPFDDAFFSFVHCRHTLEDLQNPTHAFNEIARVGRSGYIETPSPLVECLKGAGETYPIDPKWIAYRGYIHHRSFCYSDPVDNTLHIIAKFPIVEHMQFQPEFYRRMVSLANRYPLYWNNYYWFDAEHPPRVRLHRAGVDFYGWDVYFAWLERAIHTSIAYTQWFCQNKLNIPSH
jgi:hypothetical protein